MSEVISSESASENLISCAVFLADRVRSAEARAAALQPVIERFLEREDVDSAAEYADSIGDPFLRDRMLIRVIARCVELKDDEYARQLVDAIEEDGARASAKETLALQLAGRGDFEEAIAIAEELVHSAEAYAGIAVNLAIRGEHGRAIEVLDRVDFYNSRVDALVEIAAVRLRNGETAGAVEVLEKALSDCDEIEFEEDRIRSYLRLGAAFVETERKDRAIESLEKARQLAERIEGPHRDNLLAGIAVAFLAAGSVDLADRCLDLVIDKTQMASALVGFSRIYREEEDPDEALDAVEEALAILRSEGDKEIRNSKARYQVFKDIAIEFAWVGKFERAMEIAQQNPDPALVRNALVNISQISVLRGEDELSQQALAALGSEVDRVWGLLSASDAKEAADAREDAVALLDEAYGESESIPQQIVKAEIRTEIAKRYHHYGLEDRAREAAAECLAVVPQIMGDSNRAIALCDLSNLYDKYDYEVTAEDREVLEHVIRQSLA